MNAATQEAGRSYSSADAGTAAIENNVFHPYYTEAAYCCGCEDVCILFEEWPLDPQYRPLKHEWSGAPYCYGGSRMGETCQSRITSGYGVGADRCQYNAIGPTDGWAAGIDCSHFVCKCLGMSFNDTGNLPSQCNQINWDDLQQGDLLIWPGQHVMIFKQWDDSGRTNYTVVHASHDSDDRSGRVWVQGLRSRSADAINYVPYTPKCISGDPSASLAGFEVEDSGGAPLLIWETECERNTRAFWIERSSSSEGTFEKVTELIPARGMSSKGAEYRAIDTTHPGGRVYYRLIEQEIGWRVIIKAVVVYE